MTSAPEFEPRAVSAGYHAEMDSQSSSELSTFRAFAEAANITGLEIELATISKEIPPRPDISCSLGGRSYFFELSQILDEDLGRVIGKSTKEKIDSDGGWFSEEKPLIARIRAKAKKTYNAGGQPIDLLLYYERQVPFDPAEYLKDYEDEVLSALIPNGPFSEIWIFDTWTKEIIWKRRP